MQAMAEKILRVMRTPVLRRHRPGEAHFQLLRSEAEIERAAHLLAHHGGRSAARTHQLLAGLWALDTTAVFIQIDRASVPGTLVVGRHPGPDIVARGHGFRAATRTDEPAPNGAYLDERQYRRLGHYELPPAERAVVALSITAGTGTSFILDVPTYVSHVATIVNQAVVTQAMPVPSRGALRFPFR